MAFSVALLMFKLNLNAGMETLVEYRRLLLTDLYLLTYALKNMKHNAHRRLRNYFVIPLRRRAVNSAAQSTKPRTSFD